MTNTLARMVAIFNEWETRDEAELLATTREDGSAPQSPGERSALYFNKLAAELEKEGKLPSLVTEHNHTWMLPETEVVEAAQPSLHAQVGNKVTSGMGNLFGGTSWGK